VLDARLRRQDIRPIWGKHHPLVDSGGNVSIDYSQDKNIDRGRQLVSTMLEEYRDYARKVLVAYDAEIDFYQRCGFEIGTGKTPMFVTYLAT